MAVTAPEALVPIQYFLDLYTTQHSQTRTVSSQPAVSGSLDLPRSGRSTLDRHKAGY